MNCIAVQMIDQQPWKLSKEYILFIAIVLLEKKKRSEPSHCMPRLCTICATYPAKNCKFTGLIIDFYQHFIKPECFDRKTIDLHKLQDIMRAQCCTLKCSNCLFELLVQFFSITGLLSCSSGKYRSVNGSVFTPRLYTFGKHPPTYYSWRKYL